jgi:hypothetical protein
MRLPRLHKSTVVVGMIAIVVAVLLEVPGRVVRGTGGGEKKFVIEHGFLDLTPKV